MDDERIIELYFERDEQAVEETSGKYGLYCMGIAFGVLGVPEGRRGVRQRRAALPRGRAYRRSVRRACARTWGA